MVKGLCGNGLVMIPYYIFDKHVSVEINNSLVWQHAITLLIVCDIDLFYAWWILNNQILGLLYK